MSEMPRQIGQYRIQRVIGVGGMATVYAGLQPRPRRTVAIKVLKSGITLDSAEHRFQREVEILGRLRHPGIAQVFEAGSFDEPGGSSPYLVVEYIPGARSILDYARDKNLTDEDRLKMFVNVCGAMDHAHRQRIIHRDLKPSNILVDERGHPKVIDFGVARFTDSLLSEQTMHTEVGQLLGTLKYMSPEQVDATPHDIDARSDVYALGLVLYRLLTEQLPYDLTGLSVTQAIGVIREAPPRPPSEIRSKLAGDLETIILKAIDKDRARRYRAAGSLGRDVMRYLANRPISARRAGPIYRLRLMAQRHRGAMLALSLVGFVGVAAAGGLWWIQQNEARKRQTMQQEMTEQDEQRDQDADSLHHRIADIEAQRAAAARRPFNLPGHESAVTAITFDCAAWGLLSATADHAITRWDIAGREAVVTFRAHEAPPWQIMLSADGARVLSVDQNHQLLLWDARSGQYIRQFQAAGEIWSVALAPDAQSLAIATTDLIIRILSVATGDTLHVLRSTSGSFGALAYSPDSALLAAASSGGIVQVWSVETGERAGRMEGPDDVWVMGFAPHGGSLVAISPSQGFVQWDVQTGEPLEALSPGGGELTDAAIDPTGHWAALLFDEKTIRVIDVLSGGYSGPSMTTSTTAQAIAVDTDGSWVAVADDQGNVRLYPVRRHPSE